ncbi:MAG: Rid family detoxifying hydrolase [Pyrinomonadaceae bacterium]
MKKIYLPDAPAPVGHYSPAVVHNGLIFVSGQLPIVPETGEAVTGSIEAQTEQCLRNLEAILKEAGSDLNHVLKTTAFITEDGLWGAVNATYKRVFGEHRPARAIIPVGELREPFLIEIEAVAAVKE